MRKATPVTRERERLSEPPAHSIKFCSGVATVPSSRTVMRERPTVAKRRLTPWAVVPPIVEGARMTRAAETAKKC